VPKVTTGIAPTVGDPSGTHLHHPQDRLLYITLCGGGGGGGGGGSTVYWLDYTSAIQVTATVALTVDEFFATNDPATRTTGADAFVSNIAMLLNIPFSTIKITCVHLPGQPCIPLSSRRARREEGAAAKTALLLINFDIVAPAVTNADNSTSDTGMSDDDTRAFLTAVLGDFTKLAKTGAFAAALELAGFPGAALQQIVYDDVVTSPDSTSKASTGATAGVIVGVVVALLVVGVVGFLLVTKRLGGAADGKRASLVDAGQAESGHYTTSNSSFDSDITVRPLEVVRGKSLRRKSGAEMTAGAAAAVADEHGPSYFSTHSRAEVQKDSLFAPGENAAYFDPKTAAAGGQYVDVVTVPSGQETTLFTEQQAAAFHAADGRGRQHDQL
jgi:hypothetical protein